MSKRMISVSLDINQRSAVLRAIKACVAKHKDEIHRYETLLEGNGYNKTRVGVLRAKLKESKAELELLQSSTKAMWNAIAEYTGRKKHDEP